VLLANAPADANAAGAGTIVTTGSCTGAPLLPGRATIRRFATLGSVAFRFTA
jgi:2-keto-4-pentenoate hydratase